MDSPVTIVMGHVPVPEVFFRNGLIATDTTGGIDGELSCVLLPENIVLQSGNVPPRPLSQPERKKPWWQIW
jgi:serine/threonine protein phosphatase 1